jgi:ribose transport system permease protein
MKAILERFLAHYGMFIILAFLCFLFSVLTLAEQAPTGEEAAKALFEKEFTNRPKETAVLIVSRETSEESLFSVSFSAALRSAGFAPPRIFGGTPADIRSALAARADSIQPPAVFATTGSSAPILSSVLVQIPALAGVPTVTPPARHWPTFLLADNIRNIANQIAVIAILAIGMTIIILTAGIDLSVGSLLALSAVVVAWLIGKFGGEDASQAGMLAASLGGVLLSGGVGAFSGLMITLFRIPPFIATLAMMQVAAGLAYLVSQGKPIYQLPESFVWLGRGADPWLKIPNAVILMGILYAAAHLVMTRTTLGRHIYAVGGNPEAARLAGVRVTAVLLFAYTLCGLLAGLGGVVLASQLKSGAPTYGLTYELYVIAAVVVGGTSLSGGEGRILGTLIGAFIIAVIQNGMNLTNVESYTQKVVLGLVILGAVLLDKMRQGRLRIKRTLSV